MSPITIPTAAEARAALELPNAWPEATIVDEIEPGAAPGMAPRLIVRRNATELAGPADERVFCLPGQPAISLFSGAGGMDLGLEQAGVCVLAQHELDAAACETLLANRPRCCRHAALIQGDLCRTPTATILKAAGLRVGETFMLTGGPPCQGFSTAGRRDPTDPRNSLLYEFLRVVREAAPQFFVMENVPGLVTMQRGRVLHDFLDATCESYYEPVYGLLNAVEYGVPQDRTRLIVVATRRDLWEIEGKLAAMPSPEYFEPEVARFLDWADDRLLLPDVRAEACDATTVYGIRHVPGQPYIRPLAPLTRRNGACYRSQAYLDLYRRLMATDPDRVVHQPRGHEPRKDSRRVPKSAYSR